MNPFRLARPGLWPLALAAGLAACSPRAPDAPPAVSAVLRDAGVTDLWPSLADGPVTVWAENASARRELADRAASFRGFLARELGAPDAGPAVQVLAVTNAAQVARLRAAAGPGLHPSAFTTGELVVLLGNALGPDSFESLAHELAHRALATTAPPGRPALPLWMEEGLAQHLGARAANALLALRGVPRLPPPEWTPDPAFSAGPRMSEAYAAAYPPPGPLTTAFYLQSRAWTGMVDSGRGTNAWPEVLSALADRPAAWREILEKRFHFPPALMQKLGDADLLRVPPDGQVPQI